MSIELDRHDAPSRCDAIRLLCRRRLGRNEALLHDALVTRAWVRTIDLLERRWSIDFLPTATLDRRTASCLKIALDDDIAWLCIGARATAVASEPFDGLPAADDPIAAFCATYMLDNLLDSLERAMRCRCKVLAWSRQVPPESGVIELGFALHTEDDPAPESAALLLTQEAAARIVQALSARERSRSDHRNLFIECDVDLARLRMPVSSLSDLACGNALLLGRPYSNHHAVGLRIGKVVASCSRKNQRLKIVSNFENSSDGGSSSSPIADVEVDVTAVLSSLTLSVDRLLALAPGAIVDLPADAGESVVLMVNGRQVARGQIVDVAGALAVQITDRLDDAD